MNMRMGMLGGLAAMLSSNAWAATVSLSGLVVNSCVLTVPTPGLLVADTAGTALRSDAGVGSRAATLTVAALGSAPTLSFAAPQYSGPSGFTPDAVEYSFSAAGSGASRGFAATAATASSNLIDTFTIHGRIARAAGFPSGTHTITTVVTCGQ